MYIFGNKTSFYPKFVHFSEFFDKNFIFRVKITNILFFRDQMYIFGYKTTGDQMYIFGYKTTVFIQNVYILVKYFGKNFVFSVKSTIFFLFFRTKCTFLGTKLQFLSKICTFQ